MIATETRIKNLEAQIETKNTELAEKQRNYKAVNEAFKHLYDREQLKVDKANAEVRKVFNEIQDLNEKIIQERVNATEGFKETTDMWDIVDQIGWGTKTTDYKFISRMLLRMSGAKRNEFETFVRSKYDELSKKLYDIVDGPSDDGFSDLCWHIVGLGKIEFDNCMRNPLSAQERYDTDQYEESFAYCLHFD